MGKRLNTLFAESVSEDSNRPTTPSSTTSLEPKGTPPMPRLPPRNSRPYDQGLLTIAVPQQRLIRALFLGGVGLGGGRNSSVGESEFLTMM